MINMWILSSLKIHAFRSRKEKKYVKLPLREIFVNNMRTENLEANWLKLGNEAEFDERKSLNWRNYLALAFSVEISMPCWGINYQTYNFTLCVASHQNSDRDQFSFFPSMLHEKQIANWIFYIDKIAFFIASEPTPNGIFTYAMTCWIEINNLDLIQETLW